jgi:hypothetical protein
MGNKNSAITINLDRADLFYFAGETLSGTVGLTVTEGNVEADDIYIQVKGETGYTTERTVRDNNGNMSTRTDYHHIPFFSRQIILAKPKAGQKEIVYTQGQYSWPFHTELPDYLPPTLNQPHSYPHVRYYLKIVIDKAWYKPNKTELRYFTVFPRVNLLQNPQCLKPISFENHNRKDITLKGTLNKLGYVPGEIIHIKLDIENPERVLIKHINLSMLQSYRIGQNSCGYNVFKTALPNIMNSKTEHIKAEFAIKIPTESIAPSYQFQGTSRGIWESVAFVNNSYMLRFVVKVEGILTNFEVDIPITLGTEPNPDLNHQQTIKPLPVSYSLDPEHSLFMNHDLPPSYESVVQNTK